MIERVLAERDKRYGTCLGKPCIEFFRVDLNAAHGRRIPAGEKEDAGFGNHWRSVIDNPLCLHMMCPAAGTGQISKIGINFINP